MKCEVKHLGLLWKILLNFTKNHAKDVFGARAFVVPFKKGKIKQVDLDIQQRQLHVHCQYLKNTQLHTLKGIDNLFKQTGFRYKDEKKPNRKFTSALHELRSSCVHVPHPKKPGTTALKAVFDGVYANTDSSTVTVMIVSDRVEAWSVYEKMSKCPFA